MSSLPLHPVVLCGGSGTRLWPLSRANFPKQYLCLEDSSSLLQHTLRRAKLAAAAARPLLVCNSDHRFILAEQLNTAGVEPQAIILEPVRRNTAPAIALAAMYFVEQMEDALMLVLPSDHFIGDDEQFKDAVALAADIGRSELLCTFGAKPSRPETGYGYIQPGQPIAEYSKGYRVKAFIEKPSLETAEALVSEGSYLWNTGMFLFKASLYLKELQLQRPDIYSTVLTAWSERSVKNELIRPNSEKFTACPSESIDYAVMQSSRDVAVIPAEFEWSDVGSWGSLWEADKKDSLGNVLRGDGFISDSRNCYIRAENRFVAAVGLENLVIVETRDSVLVIDKDRSQDVKAVIQNFSENRRKEHIDHTKIHRPWGSYETVDSGSRFQVKRIIVNPGQKLSLQMHHHRAEHWIVVTGTAKVLIDDEERLLTENQSVYIPLGKRHRLENPGRIPLHLIEVQSGSYLDEDDIVRLHDSYGR